jgi:hypothetical protein
MFKTIVIASLIAAAPIAANAGEISPLRKSVIAFYAQNNATQKAIDLDYCHHWDQRAENRTARAKLSRVNASSYDRVEKLVTAAARATNGTDSAIDQLEADFCEAASNR